MNSAGNKRQRTSNDYPNFLVQIPIDNNNVRASNSMMSQNNQKVEQLGRQIEQMMSIIHTQNIMIQQMNQRLEYLEKKTQQKSTEEEWNPSTLSYMV